MLRYGDGDPRAFVRLHGALSPRLRGLLLKLTRNEATADDLVQLTFFKAHLARETFVPRGDNPDAAVQGWYFAIARNVAMDHLRQRGRQDQRHVALQQHVDQLAELGSFEDAVIDSEHTDEIIAQVREAIALLPERLREVVELHKLRGMSMADVAERLDVREGTVRVRAHRGYKALARILGASSSSLALALALTLASAGNFGFIVDVFVSGTCQ
jgi:RNA polymerase sigma-70 factor, ECF subfamily